MKRDERTDTTERGSTRSSAEKLRALGGPGSLSGSCSPAGLEPLPYLAHGLPEQRVGGRRAAWLCGFECDRRRSLASTSTQMRQERP